VQATLEQDTTEILANKKILLVNISQQVAAAKQLEPYIKDADLVYDYMNSVTRLRREITADRAIEDMKPYWQAKRDVLEAREAIVNPKS